MKLCILFTRFIAGNNFMGWFRWAQVVCTTLLFVRVCIIIKADKNLRECNIIVRITS